MNKILIAGVEMGQLEPVELKKYRTDGGQKQTASDSRSRQKAKRNGLNLQKAKRNGLKLPWIFNCWVQMFLSIFILGCLWLWEERSS